MFAFRLLEVCLFIFSLALSGPVCGDSERLEVQTAREYLNWAYPILSNAPYEKCLREEFLQLVVGGDIDAKFREIIVTCREATR